MRIYTLKVKAMLKSTIFHIAEFIVSFFDLLAKSKTSPFCITITRYYIININILLALGNICVKVGVHIFHRISITIVIELLSLLAEHFGWLGRKISFRFGEALLVEGSNLVNFICYFNWYIFEYITRKCTLIADVQKKVTETYLRFQTTRV